MYKSIQIGIGIETESDGAGIEAFHFDFDFDTDFDLDVIGLVSNVIPLAVYLLHLTLHSIAGKDGAGRMR